MCLHAIALCLRLLIHGLGHRRQRPVAEVADALVVEEGLLLAVTLPECLASVAELNDGLCVRVEGGH